MRKVCLSAAVTLAALSIFLPAALGGEVVFKNGDKLTGEVTELGGGKLKIKSAVAGEITVSLADVSTFSTDKPVEIKLSDGSVLNQQVGKSETPGTVVTQASPAGVPGTQLDLAKFNAINEPKPVTKWTGSIKAGALLTRGNSDTDAINVGGEAVRRSVDDRISLNGQYLYGRERNDDTNEKTTSTDNWNVQGKYDYFLSKKLYLYGLTKVERDRIADLRYRIAPSFGVGYQWLEGPKANFNTEAGLGYTIEEYTSKESESFVSARLAYHYDRVLVENVKFVHNLEYLPSLEDAGKYNLNADAGVRVKLSKDWFAEGKVEWRFNSEPAPSAKENDFRYILSFGWEF